MKDLRQYIEVLEGEGELQRIRQEVDWNLEMGAVIRRSYDLRAPAPFFEKIKGYDDSFRVLGAPVGLSNRPGRAYARVALAMGLTPDTPVQEIIRVYAERQARPIPPVMVDQAPCQENILLGDQVDLFKLPVPLLHAGDGGRYLGTWHATVTKDPDTGWTNWGMYRLMVHDGRTMGGLVAGHQHIGFHYAKYESRGEPMPFAVAIGSDPMSAIVAASQVPPGQNEADVAGGLIGQPIELVKCKTVDLEVPANSEVVIEGHVPPYERREEGPFGEYTGYRAADRLPRHVFKVSAVTYRNHPILTYSCPGVPVDDVAVAMPLSKSANLLDYLQRRFPVKAVYVPPEAVTHMTIVSTKVPFPNYSKHLANAIWGSPFGRSSYYIVIVEDDVDIFDLGQVLWALTTRCHPDRGITKIPNAPGMQLLPFLNQFERNNSLGAYALFDCTWPKEWPPETVPEKASFDLMWPEEIQKRVVNQWEKGYGYRK